MDALIQQGGAPALPTPLPAWPGRTDEPAIALQIFDSIPAWAIVHAADDDRNAPLIQRGDIAVIECYGFTGWLPTDGGLFMIEHRSPSDSRFIRTLSAARSYRRTSIAVGAGTPAVCGEAALAVVSIVQTAPIATSATLLST